jgi:hypothetical protein
VPPSRPETWWGIAEQLTRTNTLGTASKLFPRLTARRDSGPRQLVLGVGLPVKFWSSLLVSCVSRTDREVAMSIKKYVVELSDEERAVCQEVVKKLKGTSQKVKRANILLKSDLGWTDEKIAEAFNCRRQTVENVRRRLVECGFDQTLIGKQRAKPSVPKLLDGVQEAKIIAMRLGGPSERIRQMDAATPGSKGCRAGNRGTRQPPDHPTHADKTE